MGDDDDDDNAKAEAGNDAFRQLAGEDGEIDAYELKDIVNATFRQSNFYSHIILVITSEIFRYLKLVVLLLGW